MTRRPFVALWLTAAGVAAFLPLVADEAYYLEWSKALDLGYFDHPPGIAYWVAAGFGHPRLPGLLCFPLTAWLLTRAAAAWGAPDPRRVALLVLGTPLGLAGLCLATPDAPLFPLTAAMLWALGVRRFWAVGLLLGLCLWVKTTAVLALPVLLWAAGRRAFRVLLPAALVYLPHLIWSLENDGLPFTFQAGRLGHGFHVPEMLAGQLLVVTPPLALAALGTLRRALSPGTDPAFRILAGLAASQLVVRLLVACTARVEANWPAFAWMPTLLVLGRSSPAAWARAQRWAFGLTLGTAAGACLAVRLLPAEAGTPRDPDRLAECVLSERLPVASRYQERALLAAAGRSARYLRAAGGRSSQYDRWPSSPVPTCGFLYLGSPEALDGRCAGPTEPATVCGRLATRCRCTGDLAP